MNCENCAKQYTCKTLGQYQCRSYRRWIETKNYGEVKRIEYTYDITKTEEESTY